jgi:predicted amidohydrolase
MSVLGIASIQLAAAKSGNLALVEQEVCDVAKRFPWVEMVVLSELAVHGVSLAKAEAAGGATEQALQNLARETGLWLIPGSMYEKRDGKIYNMAPVINPEGEIIARHDKWFPFLPYEKNVEFGENYVVFDVPGKGRIGLAICYDMWFPEAIRTLIAQGAEMIILPTMTNTVDRDVEVSIARANAAIHQCYFIDVNVAGEQGNGRSVFYGPGGELLYEAGTNRELVALEVDFAYVRKCRQRGWNGLGQVLKSFRDAPLQFPAHSDPAFRASIMKDLGPLTMPGSGSTPEPSSKNDSNPKPTPRLKVIE